MNWRYMCQREASMQKFGLCKHCGKEVLLQSATPHNCNEKRAALGSDPPTVAEILYDADEGEGKE